MEAELFSGFWGHVEELRKTLLRVFWVLIAGFFAALYFSPSIIEFLSPEKKLLILNPLDGIILTCKLCFWTSFAFTSPLWIFFVLRFVFPGLKHREKKAIFPFLFFSFLFIGAALYVAYNATLPLAVKYLDSFNNEIGVNAWTLPNYIHFTLFLFLGHVIVFEISLMLLFLVHYRVISAQWLQEKRKLMIVAAFILGGILTPPDILTQLMFAIPLIGIYEAAILYAKVRED